MILRKQQKRVKFQIYLINFEMPVIVQAEVVGLRILGWDFHILKICEMC